MRLLLLQGGKKIAEAAAEKRKASLRVQLLPPSPAPSSFVSLLTAHPCRKESVILQRVCCHGCQGARAAAAVLGVELGGLHTKHTEGPNPGPAAPMSLYRRHDDTAGHLFFLACSRSESESPANVGQVRQEQMACFQVECGFRIRTCRRKLKVLARPSELGSPPKLLITQTVLIWVITTVRDLPADHLSMITVQLVSEFMWQHLVICGLN